MAEASRLLVVGGGKMGEALVAGLMSAGGPAAGGLIVVERDEERRYELATRYKALQVASDVAEGVAAAGRAGVSGAVVAVKPVDVEAVCIALAAAGVSRVLSIAAGVTLSSLEKWLAADDGDPAVVRGMPNTPAVIGSGAAAIASGTWATEEDVEWAHEILESVGTVVHVAEAELDAVTGLSGSGPAYIFLVAEALMDAGVEAGLDPVVADDLVRQTLLGSARLLAETGEPPAALRAAVTSPGGTTAAGVAALESAGLPAAIVDAVAAATERSRQLGRPDAQAQ